MSPVTEDLLHRELRTHCCDRCDWDSPVSVTRRSGRGQSLGSQVCAVTLVLPRTCRRWTVIAPARRHLRIIGGRPADLVDDFNASPFGSAARTALGPCSRPPCNLGTTRGGCSFVAASSRWWLDDHRALSAMNCLTQDSSRRVSGTRSATRRSRARASLAPCRAPRDPVTHMILFASSSLWGMGVGDLADPPVVFNG